MAATKAGPNQGATRATRRRNGTSETASRTTMPDGCPAGLSRPGQPLSRPGQGSPPPRIAGEADTHGPSGDPPGPSPRVAHRRAVPMIWEVRDVQARRLPAVPGQAGEAGRLFRREAAGADRWSVR